MRAAGPLCADAARALGYAPRVPDPRLPKLVELRERYVDRDRPLPKAIEAALRADPRPGAQAILEAIDRRRLENRSEGQRLRHLCRHEQALWTQGIARIAGVDEAGMAPLAGPVVAAAVILPCGYRRNGIDDSKKLSPDERAELVVHIKREALAWGVGSVDPEEIDRINIYHAGLLAMRRAVEALSVVPEYLLIDARSLRGLAIPQRGIVRGDAESISIAAASIVAKTTRDAHMTELEHTYPGYGFAQHKGYPVEQHLRAITELGVLPIHRRSFMPIKQALGLVPEQMNLLIGVEPNAADLATE
jgi:ribonuclease HII